MFARICHLRLQHRCEQLAARNRILPPAAPELVIPSHTQAIEAQVDNQNRALVQSFTSARANGSSVFFASKPVHGGRQL
jgi:hypothetical protein